MKVRYSYTSNNWTKNLKNLQNLMFEKTYANVIKSLQEAAKEAVRIRAKNNSNKIWWNDEIDMLI